mmetsp:Transcript_74340/g.170468  ORF Transcript_74340/g.170468 Transcript_74340/m.170468 type:complete len:514 (+) Transcript_74340:22-1563(+)
MPDSGSGNVRDPTSPESPLSPGSPGRRVRPELNRARSGLSAPRSPDRARTRANREGLKRQASKKSSPQSTAKTDAPQSQERFRAQLAAVHHLSGSIGTRPRASGFWDPSRPHLGILKTALACGHLDAVSELTRDCRCADIVPADDPCTAACHLDELDERWRSLLHLSASAGQLPIVKMLLKRRASLEHRDDRGRTALHRAVQNGRDKVCQELLKTRADTNATDMDGLTPLHVAAMSDTRWCAIYLVLAGSSISLLSGHGLSPILTARMARNFAMERLLATMNDEDTLPWWMEDGQIEKLASGEVPFYRGGEVYSPSAEEEKWLAALRDHEPSSSKFFFLTSWSEQSGVSPCRTRRTGSCWRFLTQHHPSVPRVAIGSCWRPRPSRRCRGAGIRGSAHRIGIFATFGVSPILHRMKFSTKSRRRTADSAGITSGNIPWSSPTCGLTKPACRRAPLLWRRCGTGATSLLRPSCCRTSSGPCGPPAFSPGCGAWWSSGSSWRCPSSTRCTWRCSHS